MDHSYMYDSDWKYFYDLMLEAIREKKKIEEIYNF